MTGDGLIVRVRARGGALAVSQLIALADIARRYGNGLIDLTRRANLQLRGVTEAALPGVWHALSDAGLMDAHAEAEAVRNVMVSPLAGIDPTEVLDVRPIAMALERALTETAGLWALPGKFGFIVDGGGMLPLDSERADVRLKAVPTAAGVRVALGVETAAGVAWLRLVDAEAACAAAVRLATAFLALPNMPPRARMRDLESSGLAALRQAIDVGVGAAGTALSSSADGCGNRVGAISPGGRTVAVGLGAPLGRTTADEATLVARAAADLGVAEVRVSPWRVLYVPVDGSAAETLIGTAARHGGLVAAAGDPLMAIDACPGAPACRSACVDTRAAALCLAASMPLAGIASVHVSGCAKGCARSRPADLVLVGLAAGFGVVRHARASDPPTAILAPDQLDDLPAILNSWV